MVDRVKIPSFFIDSVTEKSNASKFGIGIKESKEVAPEKKEETHVCPLCSTQLAEAISDEALTEHAVRMAEVFQAAEEALLESIESEEEDEDEVEDQDDEEDQDIDEDEDEEEIEEEEEELDEEDED